MITVKLPHFCFDWQPFFLPLLPSKLFLGHCCWHFWFLCFFLRRLWIVTYLFHSNGFTNEHQYKFLTLSSFKVSPDKYYGGWHIGSRSRQVRDFSVNSSAMARNGFALVSVVVSCLHDKKNTFTLVSILFNLSCIIWFNWHQGFVIKCNKNDE